ncbi:alpha-ribazole phosphatase [Paenibacillus sp. J31TS4]|uniref:histidine phosphatase family protein n=1 Tax=Paenibacillus sp. J31TS4 TaxID=2807195 RepID=UPI001B2765A8|nr:histidine phosphatase family protein [Paenibacillus sp. J31TS4]GIP37726.1 alpha-ribazole phosphatase [Paenibacillus sp. J31TS4]
MSTRYYLIRHGETEWNRDGNRYCGRSDICLSPRGADQAEQLAVYLQHVPLDRVYASTLRRAYDTAGPLAHTKGLPIVRDARAAEIDFGLWEGLRSPEISDKHAEAWAAWQSTPESHPAGLTGETAGQVYGRMRELLLETADRHPGEAIAVVSHSTTLRIFLAGMLGMPLSRYRSMGMDNIGISVVETEEGEFRLHHHNLIPGFGVPEAIADN